MQINITKSFRFQLNKKKKVLAYFQLKGLRKGGKNHLETNETWLLATALFHK